ncbi:DedA family protein [Paenibacillus sp. GCM10028914]|uniref:DedA family protein n=1 Tax=Paenibacillus sp. GCM10028914 TaxID=3273416 RepID=UPI003623FF66
MISNTVIQLVEQYGYLAFFLAFSLGPFGIPVPNEITIITGGILSNADVLDPWKTYIFILTGLLTAITLSYFAGRFFGLKIRTKFQSNHSFHKAEKMFIQQGELAMCFGLCIPIVRYIMPLLVGLSGVRFKKFALISYFSALLWTVAFFTIGRYLETIV